MLRKRVSAIALALSLGITALAPLAPSNVQEVKAAETSVIDRVPPMPTITRYSTSGWDATWFRMESNLQLGTCIYTIDPDPTKDEVNKYNPNDYTITELPDKFVGCDYILNRMGKQPSMNHHFYAEQDIVIYAAIDEKQQSVPKSLNGYTKTDGTLKIKNGTKYWLAKKEYSAGLVKLNKYDGTGNNVFYMALPKNGKAVSQALTHNEVVPKGNKPEKNAADEKYQYYLNSVYNLEEGNGVPKGYTGSNVSISEPAEKPQETEKKPENKTYKASDNIALNKPVYGTSKNDDKNPVDGSDQTYYEAPATPSELTVALLAECQINKIAMCVKKSGSWKDRTQNIEVRISNDRKNYKTIIPAKDYVFKQGQKIELNVPAGTKGKYIQLLGKSNTGADGMQIAEFEVYGPAQSVTLVPEPDPKPELEPDQNRHVVVAGGGNLTKTFDTPVEGKIIYEGKVRASAVNQKMSIPVMKSAGGRTAVDLTFSEDGWMKAGNTNVVTYEANKWYVIKMIIDTETRSYDVYVDHMRKAQNVGFTDTSASNIKTISWTSGAGTLNVDNVRLYDNPEVYVIQDNFNAEKTGTPQPANWTISDTSKSAIQNVPFAVDKSLQIQNSGSKVMATRNFGALTGDVTIEAKVKPMDDSWATVPAVYDSKGNVVLKIAAYQNSFFISNGNNWTYLCEQETKHNYYPAANWYNLKIVLNTYSNRYDFYVDGAKRFTQASFVSDVDDVASMSFAAEEKNVLYIDNVNVYDSASLARGLYPKENVFNVRDFGAVGDGKTDDTEAIDDAIRAAAYTGGTVVLENGTFYCGQITMQNDMTLFVDASATIFFKMNRNDYTHFRPKYNGVVGYNGNHQLGAGLIRSIETNTNFRINGGGTLDGNGFYGYNENDPGNQRPCALYLTSSDDFSVENINIINSPHWTFVPYESTRMTIRNIGITNHIAPNRDGIDPVNCSNMTIENCCIFAGDDALCPKSGNAFPSINCDVRNVTMQSYCNGIKFGTDSYDAFKNYSFEDILIKNVGLSAISLQAVDGSAIENISFRRIDMIDVDNSIAFMVGCRQRANSGLAKHLGHIKGVVIEDMNYTNPMVPPYSHQNENEHANMFVGLNPDKSGCSSHKGNDKPANSHTYDGKNHFIEDVFLKNVYLEMPGGYDKVPSASSGINSGYPEHGGMGNPTGWANTIRWAENIRYDNCKSVLLTKDVRTEYDYRDYKGENLNNGVDGKIKYGIVFEKNGKALENPVLSGVISPGQSTTVLNYSLLHALKEDNGLTLDRATYEGAVMKCDADGKLTLTDITGVKVLAEGKMEKFSNESGQRLVFHVGGNIDENSATKNALTVALKEAAKYEGKSALYTKDSWSAFSTALDAAKKATDSTSLNDRKTLLTNLNTAMDNLARPLATWIEAETGELTGGAKVEDAAECSGSKKAGYLGGTNKGRVSFRVNVKEAGAYVISVQYCQAEERQLNIEVNGASNAVPCLHTGGWSKPSQVPVQVVAKLNAGMNEIALTGVGTTDAPGVDCMKVDKVEMGTIEPDVPVTPAEPPVIAINTLVEAEAGLLENGTVIRDGAACSGGKYVEGFGETGVGTVTFVVNVEEAGNYDVIVTYCSDMDRQINVKVNGVDHAVSCPSGGNWIAPSATPAKATVALNQGKNTLVLTGVANTAPPNVDCIKIEKASEVTTPSETTTPSEPATEPSEPATEPSEPATEPSEPATEPSEPATEQPSEPASEPSEPSAPNEPTEPSEPATEPSEPATVPSEPTIPNQPTAPSQPAAPTQPTTPAIVLSEQETKMANMFGVTPEVAKQIAAVVTQYKVSDATLAVTEKSVQALKNDKDIAGSSFAAIQAKAAKQTKNSIKLIWNRVSGADGYIILGNECGTKNSYETIANITGTSYTDKKLDKGTYYKYIVCAYKNVAGTKVTLAASKTIHTVTKGGKFRVAKSVKVNPTNVKLSVGKTKKLLAKEVNVDKKMKPHRKVAYETTNPAVATVTKNGKIKARSQGKCYVYVYAQNGVYKKVKVTVK